jgi:hypothetical protein
VIIQEPPATSVALVVQSFPTRYNLLMRFAAFLPVLVLYAAALAQSVPNPASQPEPEAVTVPITLSHNRVIIDAVLSFPDGTTQRVRAWIDNGNPELHLSRRLAALTGSVSCDGQLCAGTPPVSMNIGGMTIALGGGRPGAGIKEATVPAGGAPIAPGLAVEINVPSTVLRGYDVLVDFPDRKFTIAQPGSVKFKGVNTKVIVNPQNGLIQIPSQIGGKKYNLALDLGASISFLSGDLFDKLATTHPDWPQMTGAVGPANMWGLDDEAKWKLMRVDRVEFGPLFLTGVPMADFPADRFAFFEKRADVATAGLLGAEALLNYRVGIDYAHSTVYFDIGRLFNFPDFDVVGLILRPEDDGRFTILGVADYEGKPSVPQGSEGVQPGDHLIAVDGIPVPGSTLGQVWSMLGGSSGQERVLTVERDSRQFTVFAKVQHFLGDVPQEDQSKRSRKKN